MKNKYHPFNDRKHLLLSALEDAISWEESRLDAGCDIAFKTVKGEHIRDDKATAKNERNTQERIKAYRAMGRHLRGEEIKTPSDRLDAMLRDMEAKGEIKAMTMTEIKAAHKKQKHDKRVK